MGKTSEVAESDAGPETKMSPASLARRKSALSLHLSTGVKNEKKQRVAALKEYHRSAYDTLPSSYRKNTNKETLCDDYVSDFQKRFTELFPGRRRLFLTPQNECNVRKLVSTTLGPSMLKFRSLYNAKPLAKFVAGFLEFEPLENPLEPPSILPSPTTCVEWQKGDSFDFATLLCSLLLGAGYDAFCVFGYAPRWVCQQDQTRSKCPLLEEEEEERLQKEKAGKQAKGKDDTPYQIVKRFDFQSKFQLAQERRKQKKNDAEKAERENLMGESELPEKADPLAGKRVHCWVLIKQGKRGQKETVLVEPTSGRFYSMDKAPYLGIESVWNNRNYWVCKQDATPCPGTGGVGALKDIQFDLVNTDCWEFVFFDKEMREKSDENKDGQDDFDNDKDEEDDNNMALMDIPNSWVSKIQISREKYIRRFGKDKCQKLTLYKKAKLELFSEHMHNQGIVSRLTIYEDIERVTPIEIREEFKHRADKLVRRVRYPLKGRVHEHFAPGQHFKLRELVQQMGKWHKLRFYMSARLDGLQEREEVFGKKMIEKFQGRDDCLTYRSVSVLMEDSGEKSHIFTLPGGVGGEMVIRKMAQKFSAKPETAPEKCVFKRSFFVLPTSETKIAAIREKFHYAENRITARIWTYPKDQEGLGKNTEEHYGAAADGRGGGRHKEDDEGRDGADQAMSLERQRRQAIAEQAEKECYQAVRESKRETEEILRMRWEEEQSIELVKNLFDRVRERVKTRKQKDTGAEKEEDEDISKGVDYLTPFLPEGKQAQELTKEEAQKANDLCLKGLKERLVERANIIQRRLDKENEALAKRQAAFQRSRDPVEGADEAYEKFCMDAMFRIQILEQRLQKHEDTAMDKYEQLIKKLQDDTRIAPMHQ